MKLFLFNLCKVVSGGVVSGMGNSDGIPDGIYGPEIGQEGWALIISIFLNIILITVLISVGIQNLSLKSEMKELKKKSDKEDA